MQELIPLFCGLLVGAALGAVRPRIRVPLAVVLSVAIGVFATVVTGEFKSSWGYVLVDIPLVACATFLGLMLARRVRPMRLQ